MCPIYIHEIFSQIYPVTNKPNFRIDYKSFFNKLLIRSCNERDEWTHKYNLKPVSINDDIHPIMIILKRSHLSSNWKPGVKYG